MFLLVLIMVNDVHAAGNLCSLTQAQVQGVLTWYGSSYTYNDVVPYIASPLNCSTYGDLCEEVGATRANTFICDRWAELKNHVPTATVIANAAAQFEQMQEARIDELFPNGIPSDSPWWGTPMGGGSLASESTDTGVNESDYLVADTGEWGDTEEDTSASLSSCEKKTYAPPTGGTRRVRSKSWYTMTLVYDDIGTNAKAYIYLTSDGKWHRDASGPVGVSYDAYGGLCSDSGTKTDGDGKIGQTYSGVLMSPWVNFIDGNASYSPYGLTAHSCRNAIWSSACSPP